MKIAVRTSSLSFHKGVNLSSQSRQSFFSSSPVRISGESLAVCSPCHHKLVLCEVLYMYHHVMPRVSLSTC
jgi:hypothetical protein